MATLVLTVVGGAIGGPIGAALGSLTGRAVDARLLQPARRAGPRLTELQVQTSSYGSAIPAVFGAMRVAGTVIWATDIRERSQSTGGKSGGSTSYSYSVSLAVALSSRPVRAIGRIWAEGNLLRGVAGDFKTPVGAFRLHRGLPGQAVDPLIAADVGPGQAPAYRGLAYVVLEDVQLAAFGNRIPSLTFEVEADEAPVRLTVMASALAGLPVDYRGDREEPRMAGYAAEGRDAMTALTPLLDSHAISLTRAATGGPLLVAGRKISSRLGAAAEIAFVDGKAADRSRLERSPLEEVPRRLALRYYDVARDYHAGLQWAERPGAGRRSEQLDLAAALDAGAAKALVERALRRDTHARRRLAISHGWPALCWQLGDVLHAEGHPGAWRIEAIEWSDMAPRLTLVGDMGSLAPDAVATADSGSGRYAPDVVQGSTRLMVFDLPPMGDELAVAPRLWALACGENDHWRWANVFRVDAASGASQTLGMVERSIHGRVIEPPARGDARRIDRASHAVVELWDENAMLAPCGDADLLRGRNLCLMGGELMQFGAAEQIAPRRYRLSRFLRARGGTEEAMDAHSAQEPFALLEGALPLTVPVSAGERGADLLLQALGPGDGVPQAVSVRVDGRAMLPLSPVHGRCTRMADGARSLSWIRRSRQGWSWPDGGDVPLGEEAERYRVTIVDGDGLAVRSVDVFANAWIYAQADQAIDQSVNDLGRFRAMVRQLGTFGAGPALTIALTE